MMRSDTRGTRVALNPRQGLTTEWAPSQELCVSLRSCYGAHALFIHFLLTLFETLAHGNVKFPFNYLLLLAAIPSAAQTAYHEFPGSATVTLVVTWAQQE
eukprot:scaffold296200_cov19-Tisochrysis_lutea.AAC.1